MKKLIPLFFFLSIVAVFAVIYWEVNKVPVVHNIYPQTAQAKEIVQIKGKNFGSVPDKVFLSDYRVSDKDIIFWSSKDIHIQVPENTTSSFLSVKVSSRMSNKVLLIIEDELPYIENIPSPASRVPAIFPSRIGVGELLTIRDMRVTAGENVQGVYVPMERGMRLLADRYYVNSTPQELVIQIPDGMQSGMIYIQMSQDEIELGPITIITKGGERTRDNLRRFLVLQSVKAEKEGVPKYFRIHSLEENFAQPLIRLLQGDSDMLITPFIGHTEDGLELRRIFEIFRYRERIEFSSDFIHEERQYAPLFVQEYLSPSPFIPSDNPDLMRFAAQRLESTDLDTARALYEAVITRLQPDDAFSVADVDAAVETFDNQTGTAFGFSALLNSLLRSQDIPSRMIRGYLLEDATLIDHYWVEFFLHGFGWVACDPYLESVEEAPLFTYFAQLHAERFALARLPLRFYTFLSKSRFTAGIYPSSPFQETWAYLGTP